jgi:uncharacterized protein (DUF2141 family)
MRFLSVCCLALFFLFLRSTLSYAGENYSLTIEIDGFESDDGKAMIAVFNSKDGYPVKPEKAYKKLISEIKNGKVTLVINGLPAGTYAVSVLHDENDNGKMDTNFLGIPSENFGASNDAKGFMGPPSFEDSKFELQTNNKKIKINMQ